MRCLLQFTYTVLIMPLLFFMACITGIFSGKIRKFVLERFKVIKKLKQYKASQQKEKNYILIHCASMGEFEHIKPLITKLSSSPKNAIIVTFFSSSGYENVKEYSGVDLILYTPFDFPGQWKKFYDILKPKFLIISKHDAWPNQIWAADKQKIPIFLVNASLNENSSRIKGLAKILYNEVYRSFSRIHAVSESNKANFEKHFKNINVDATGDTKFDQVSLRRKHSEQIKYIPESWLGENLIIILGSVWSEDMAHLSAPVNKLLANYNFIKIIIAPHQPTEKQINEIRHTIAEGAPTLYTKDIYPVESRVLLIDTVGILADLYKYAHIAFVGGSFKQGIHNVMEPAIYGIPVLFGPVHSSSIDAGRLKRNGGGIEIHNQDEALEVLTKLIKSKNQREKTGDEALNYALENTGVSEQLLQQWRKYLD